MLADAAYTKAMDDGRRVRVKDTYCVEADTFTDCEAMVTREASADNCDDFFVMSEKRAPFCEVVFADEATDMWFAVKVDLISLDEKTEKEQRVRYTVLVEAGGIDEAREAAAKSTGGICEYEIRQITRTKIVGVIEYNKQ